MDKSALHKNILAKKSFLCVGLDPDPLKIPIHLRNDKDGVFKFCKSIIENTKSYCVAYKPNIAFFESMGPKGWETLERVMAEVPKEIFTIADAKRGDIGNTSKMYAKTFFEYFNFDAITVAPYMGEDSVTPFLEFEDKWVILLGLTSNKGSADFQMHKIGDEYLYEKVITQSQNWGNPNNLMYVIGATHPGMFSQIRNLAKEFFFLVPGIGAQGGDLNAVVNHGMNDSVGLLVNSSRGIIYAGNGEDFGEKSRLQAKNIADQMATFI